MGEKGTVAPFRSPVASLSDRQIEPTGYLDDWQWRL